MIPSQLSHEFSAHYDVTRRCYDATPLTQLALYACETTKCQESRFSLFLRSLQWDAPAEASLLRRARRVGREGDGLSNDRLYRVYGRHRRRSQTRKTCENDTIVTSNNVKGLARWNVTMNLDEDVLRLYAR